jgi:hypothetical protein
VLPWYLGGGAARYCEGQGASYRWSTNRLFGSVVPFVVAAVGGFHTLMVGDIEDVRFGYAVEVGEVDWGCFDGAVVRTEALAFVPIGEGS